MNYYLYKTTNLVNGKIYIGIHESDNIEKDEYLGSGKLFKKALLKYGKTNFKREILFKFDNLEDALKKEAEIVNSSFIQNNDNYNLIRGGGGPNNPEIIGKIAISCKEIWKNPQKRKERSERTKKQFSDPAMRERVSKKLKGRKFSETHKSSISDSLKKYYGLIKDSNWTKNFHSNGGKTSKNTKYIKNPLNNEIKRVDINELEKYIKEGWQLGTGRSNATHKRKTKVRLQRQST